MFIAKSSAQSHDRHMSRMVTLCDEQGHKTGESDLLSAHLGEGKLHIAFSVFLFTPDYTKTLIQQRSMRKMLWPGIWANTCCSHPFEHETPSQAGERRLQEELGISAQVTPELAFVYRAEDPNKRGVEHEYDTVLIGTMEESTPINPNPEEVHAWKWITLDELQKDMRSNPDTYAPWFHKGMMLLLQTERFRHSHIV